MDATYKADLKEINDLNWAGFKAEMDAGLKALKSELLAWMFAFWVTTTVTLAGLILTR